MSGDGFTNPLLAEQARSANLGQSLARQETEAALSKARVAEENAANAMRLADANASHDRRIISALRRQVDAEREAAHKALIEAQELRKLMIEWQHAHDAFRQASREYGGQLGMSKEARQRRFDEILLELVKENPDYSATRLVGAAQARLQAQG